MTSAARPGSARRGRRGAGQVATGTLAFVAVAASVVAAFTDDARVLKLALVTALWVAVAALGAVEVFRKRSDTASARSQDLRLVYELELEREVHARREHELAVEREVRVRVSAQVRDESRLELDELREELKALRENLSVLLSGDLLVERVALRAESTRLRSLTDTARLESGTAAQLVPGPTVDALDAETVEPTGPFPVTVQPVAVPVPVRPVPPIPVPPVAVPPVPVRPVPSPDPAVAAAHAPTEVIPVIGAAPEPWAVPLPEPVPEPSPAPEPVREPVPEPAPAPEPVAEAAAPGAHSAGRSVSDLIAAYGASDGAPRRRRRAED